MPQSLSEPSAPATTPSAGQSLGPRLRVARENAGLSTEALSRRLGVQAESIAAWERDERTPRVNRLVMLAGILDVSMKWLLEGRESEYMQSHGSATVESLRAELERLEGALDEARQHARNALSALEDLSSRLAGDSPR